MLRSFEKNGCPTLSFWQLYSQWALRNCNFLATKANAKQHISGNLSYLEVATFCQSSLSEIAIFWQYKSFERKKTFQKIWLMATFLRPTPYSTFIKESCELIQSSLRNSDNLLAYEYSMYSYSGVCMHHRIINDRMEKYESYILFISKQHCRSEEFLSRREIAPEFTSLEISSPGAPRVYPRFFRVTLG